MMLNLPRLSPLSEQPRGLWSLYIACMASPGAVVAPLARNNNLRYAAMSAKKIDFHPYIGSAIFGKTLAGGLPKRFGSLC